MSSIWCIPLTARCRQSRPFLIFLFVNPPLLTSSSVSFNPCCECRRETVVLTSAQVENHPVSMVDQFRKLHLPVQVVNGKVTLTGGPHTLCREGDELTADVCKTLVHFGVKMSEFKVELKARWHDEEVTEY